MTDLIPDVPTVKELTGHGDCQLAPPGDMRRHPATDPAILEKLRQENEAAHYQSDTIEQMNAMGCGNELCDGGRRQLSSTILMTSASCIWIFLGLEMIPD